MRALLLLTVGLLLPGLTRGQQSTMSTHGITTATIPGSDNTNTVFITLSETNAVNGAYVFQTGATPSTYTNASNTLVNHDSTGGGGFNWVISNNVYGQVIAFDTIPNFNGGAGGGAYILPGGSDSLTQSKFATNTISYRTFAGFGSSSNQDLYVDANGSDYLALRGHPELPFRTLAEAALVWRTNDTIHVAAGTYTNTGVTPLAGQTIIGNGKFVTILAGVTITGSGISLQNLSCGIITVSGSNQNLTISGVRCVGAADGLFLQAKYRNLVGVDSEFISPWDAWADYQSGYLLDNTNNSAEFTRCAFISDAFYPGTPGKECLVVGQGKVRFNDCCFRARQNLAAPVAVAWTDPTAKGTNGYMEFWNCAFDYANTNGAALAISNSIGAIFSLHGCSINAADIYDPSNKVAIASDLSAARLPAAMNSLVVSNSVAIDLGLTNFWALRQSNSAALAPMAGAGTNGIIYFGAPAVFTLAVTNIAGTASTAANATTAINAQGKGWTNTFAVNATVYLTNVTTIPFTLINASRTILTVLSFTNGTVNLQPGWAVTNTAGLNGVAVPW